MALFHDVHIVSPPRSGDAILKDVDFTGWSNSDANNERGRVYWKVTTGNVLNIYKEKAYTNLLAHGDVPASDLVTLTADNGSGLSGTCVCVHTAGTESTGEIILTFCKEKHLVGFERDVADYLVSGAFLGDTRFENPLMQAMDWTVKVLRNTLRKRFKSTNEVDLSIIAKPEQLAKAQACKALYHIFLAVGNGDDAMMSLAKAYDRMAKDELDLVEVDLDVTNSGSVTTAETPQTRISL